MNLAPPPSVAPRALLEQVLALLAVAAPLLLAWNVAPSSTFLNQALAIGGWGGFLWAMLAAGPARRPLEGLSTWGLAAASSALLLVLGWWLDGLASDRRRPVRSARPTGTRAWAP